MQELVATVRGALIDLAWKAPDFDVATRELVGYELFRDDMDTRPPSRRTWKTMPGDTLEVRGLEDLPSSEYGVQPIWRMVAESPALIEFGPPRLSKDVAVPRQVVFPPEERIHSLAWLQRDGLITSAELELAVDELLGRTAQPAPEPQPALAAAVSGARTGAPTAATTRRVLVAYGAVAVVLVLVVAVGFPLAGRLLFAHPTAVHVSPSPSPVLPSPSPTPSARQVNLATILIKPTDLRSGYVAGKYDSSPLCAACVPALYSLSVVLQNQPLHRSIITATSVAPSATDSSSVVRALMTYRSSGSWSAGKGLGDESHLHTETRGGRTYFYVVWRAGVVTDEIVLIAPPGSRTMQDALDLAKVQQARTVARVK